MPALGRHETLWIYSMGKRFQVLAIFADNDAGTKESNDYCERHNDAAVIAIAGGQIFIASKYQTKLEG